MCAEVGTGVCVERVLSLRFANYHRAITIEEYMKLGPRRGLVACKATVVVRGWLCQVDDCLGLALQELCSLTYTIGGLPRGVT
jgi:hypothetical protein